MTLKSYPDWTWDNGIFHRDMGRLRLEVRWQRNYRYAVLAAAGAGQLGVNLPRRLLDEGTRTTLRLAIAAAENAAALRLGNPLNGGKAAADG